MSFWESEDRFVVLVFAVMSNSRYFQSHLFDSMYLDTNYLNFFRQVLSRDESTVVGKISKQWSGLARELFTDADNFGISFPLDLDVRMKAVMMGACFLIVRIGVLICICKHYLSNERSLHWNYFLFKDFMYFEKTGNEESDGIGLCWI